MPESVVVRISKNIEEKAMTFKKKEDINYMDKKSWLSFLIEKGIEKMQEEKH